MNFEALLAPISEASRCGDDLSFSREFDAIQELRREDDPTLDQGEWITALKTADWPGVVEHCTELLNNRTKDLRAAAWLADASARLGGYSGLADGLTLCRLMCERFWDDLHPRLDDDGAAEQRGGSLRWLLSHVEYLTPQLPVLKHGSQAFSLRDLATARATPTHGGGTGETLASARVTSDLVAAARKATPREFFAKNWADAQRAHQALEQLRHVVDGRLGLDAPSFAASHAALSDAVHAVERLAREANPVSESAAASQRHEIEPASSAALLNGAPGSLVSRADALRQLRAVADFFRRTEPHSPVAYLADRAAQWGDMPLHTWLRAVVKDAGALSHMEELLGVAPPPANAGD